MLERVAEEVAVAVRVAEEVPVGVEVVVAVGVNVVAATAAAVTSSRHALIPSVARFEVAVRLLLVLI